MTLILGLGGLATEAAQRGDDRAAGILRQTVELLVRDAADVEARQKKRDRDAERLATRRASRATNAESRDRRDSPSFSPTPPFPTPDTTTHTAREADRGGMVEAYSAQLATQMGDDLWPDVDAFVKRRPFEKWTGWLREMLAAIGPGSQFVPDDLARVCRDDAALDRPLGSPKALRSFLGSARLERMQPNGRGSVGGIGQRAYDTTLDALKDIA